MAEIIAPDDLIQREACLKEVVSYKDKRLIKVITGVRRSGKSILLFHLYKNWLMENGVGEEQIILVDLELKTNKHLLTDDALYNHVKAQVVKSKKNYIIIDEVQNCKDFQRAVDSLFAEGFDVYITGSNAFILSGELATLLSGRYVEIEVKPLSFKEYVLAVRNKGNKESEERLYREYAQNGGFPYIVEFGGNEKQVGDYLDAIYNTIFKKDILDKHKISDSTMLEDVIKFVMDNVGNPLSSRKISDTMTSNGRKISQPTIENYLQYLTEAYLVYKADRYDIKGKAYLKFLSKYYVVDIGLRNHLLNYHAIDRGSVLENIIYIELLRRGYKVNVGKVNATEVDFVATKNGETIYIQVAESIVQKETMERELIPLKDIKDFNARWLITLDYDINKSYDGIKHINAIDFLME
jgi:predicted AAA+ superfamily ATPase